MDNYIIEQSKGNMYDYILCQTEGTDNYIKRGIGNIDDFIS